MSSGNVIAMAYGHGSNPVMRAKILGTYNKQQLWRFIPTGDGASFLIQNYSLDDNGLVWDAPTNHQGVVLIGWDRTDNNNNPNQKFYPQLI